MGPHRGALQYIPPQGIKNFAGIRADFILKFEIKKVFVGEDINIKRLKWDRLGEHYISSRHGGYKIEHEKKRPISFENLKSKKCL